MFNCKFPQVKHAQSLADHCAHLEAALSRTRSKLPCAREIATQTDRSFLCEVHADRSVTGVQRHVELGSHPGTLRQRTNDAEDNGLVRLHSTIPYALSESRALLELRSCMQGYKVASALRKVLWETIQYGRLLYGRPCHDLASFFSAVRLYPLLMYSWSAGILRMIAMSHAMSFTFRYCMHTYHIRRAHTHRQSCLIK